MYYTQLLASIFGLLATSCDSLLTRREEMEYIWKRPMQVTFVRCLFILARYLAFSIHITRIVYATLWIVRFPGHQQPTHEHCVTWAVFQILSCNVMLLILELILSIRVFALYDQSLKIGISLLTMVLGRMAGSIYVASERASSGESDLKFFGHCQATGAIGNPMLVFIIGEIVIHLIIQGLALKRTAWDLRRYTLSRPPLLSMLNRDGLKVFIAIYVAMVAFGVSQADTEIRGPGWESALLFIHPLFISLVSTLGCRTILNLQMLRDTTETSSPKQNTRVELTAINISSTWDTATRFESDASRSRPVEEVI